MKQSGLKYWKIFFIRLYERVIESDVANRSAQAAFYFSFALFPLLLFLISLFGLVLGSANSLKTEAFIYLGQLMPAEVFDLVSKTVDEVVASSSTGKLTLGLIVSLWSASAGVDGVRSGLNAVYGLTETRSWWRNKLSSLVLTLIVTALVGTVLTIVFYGWELVQATLTNIGLPVSSPLVLVGLQWATILLLMLFAFELIYNLLPSFPKAKWDWITPGSLVAIALWLVVSTLFRVYLGYFNTYDRTYGSLGAVMILILWLYLTAFTIMMGGAINSIVYELREAQHDGS